MNPEFLSFWSQYFPLTPALNFASTPSLPADTGMGGGAPDSSALDSPGDVPNDADTTAPETSDVTETTVETTEPATEDQVLETAEPVEPAAPVVPEVDPGEGITDEALADAYRSIPSLKPILKQHPELRAPFFKAVEINKLYRTVDDAKIAKEWAGQLANFDKHFFSPGVQAKRDLMKQIWENSLDEKGKPTGHYEELSQAFVEDSLTNFSRAVNSDPSWAARAGLTQEQAKAAIHFTCRMLGIGIKDAPRQATAPKPGEEVNTNRWVKEDDPEWQQWQAEQRTASEKADTEFISSMNHDFWSGTDTQIAASIKDTLPAIQKINPMLAEVIPAKIKSLIHESIASDELFEARIESMWRQGGRNPETSKRILSELESRLRQELPVAVRSVLRKAGISTVAAAGAKKARTDASNARREPVTAGGAPGRTTRPSPPKPVNTGNWNKDADRILEIDN